MSNNPNLFIIGAPKCGTTTLYHWLGQSSSVFIPRSKEPHYFSKEYRLTNLENYRELYKGSSTFRFSIDASVWYFFHKSWREIIKHNRDSKFIVLLRSPSSMMLSMHSQQIYNGNEKQLVFKKALNLNDARKAGEGERVAKGYNPGHLAYLESCCLDGNLKEFIDEIPNSQRLCLVLEDLLHEEETWQKICEFLDLGDCEIEFIVANKRRKRRSIMLDRLVVIAAKVKKLLGIKMGMGILRKIRRLNTQTAKTLDVDTTLLENEIITSRINECVKNYEKLLDRKLGSWYV